jgi:hypothetical protein
MCVFLAAGNSTFNNIICPFGLSSNEKQERTEQQSDIIQNTEHEPRENGHVYEGGKFSNRPPNKEQDNDGGIYSCAYCEIINRIENTNKNTRFETLGLYEKHIVSDHHNRLTFDPEPNDLDKFESDFKASHNDGKRKLADMAEINLSGNGVTGFNRQKDEALQE